MTKLILQGRTHVSQRGALAGFGGHGEPGARPYNGGLSGGGAPSGSPRGRAPGGGPGAKPAEAASLLYFGCPNEAATLPHYWKTGKYNAAADCLSRIAS